MDDLKSHFRMGYAPNNCVLVMVGDVHYDQVMTLAHKYHGADTAAGSAAARAHQRAAAAGRAARHAE